MAKRTNKAVAATLAMKAENIGPDGAMLEVARKAAALAKMAKALAGRAYAERDAEAPSAALIDLMAQIADLQVAVEVLDLAVLPEGDLAMHRELAIDGVEDEVEAFGME